MQCRISSPSGGAGAQRGKTSNSRQPKQRSGAGVVDVVLLMSNSSFVIAMYQHAILDNIISSSMNGSESVPGISWNLLSLDSNAATNARLTFPSNAVIQVIRNSHGMSKKGNQIWTAIPLDLNPSELRSSSCRPSNSDTHHPSRLPNNRNRYDLIKG
ncbi:hypothetical protein GE21DRAFT_1071727 [Neurospora crassa]|nr:hypothetical protein GE21DRAFT_1071727 [Neurospora crassa]